MEAIGRMDDCAVLRVVGEIDVYTAPALRARLVDLAADGVRHVIVDMSVVDFLDSAGLGVLMGGHKRLRLHDGSLTIVTNVPRILRIFQVTGLTKKLACQPSVSAAIAERPHWRQLVESEAGTVQEWCHKHGLS